MKRKLFSLMTLLLCAVTGAWADTTTLYWTADANCSVLSDANGIITLTDGSNKDGIQQGSTFSATITDKTAVKLSGSRNFTITYNAGVTINSVTLYATSNKSDATTTAGNASGGDATSYGSVPKKGDTPAVISLTGVDGEGLRFAAQSLAVIVVDYTSTDPAISATDATVTATESGVEATQDITVTGRNLTGSTLTATLSPAVAGLTVTLGSSTITDGAISTTATLHYTATENASGETTLTLSDGTTNKEVTITYRAKVTAYVQKSVSEATTWDFSKTGIGEAEFTLSGDDYRTDVLIANVTGYSVVSSFDAESMIINGDRLLYNSNCCQIQKLKFNAAVPGTVKVFFSNTGGSRPYRYAMVNETMSTTGSNTGGTQVESQEIPISAGEVVISGYIPDASDPVSRDGDNVGATFIRVYKVIFTPATETVTVSDAEYATFVATNKVAVPAGVTAYKVKVEGSSAKLTSVDVIAAGQAVVVYKEGANGDEVTFTATADDAADFSDNALTSSATDVTADGTQYVLANVEGVVGFYKVESEETIAAGKGYLVSPLGANFLSFDFDETTGVKALDKVTVSPFENSVYDLSGRKIVNGKLQKGLYIVNGKKVVIK